MTQYRKNRHREQYPPYHQSPPSNLKISTPEVRHIYFTLYRKGMPLRTISTQKSRPRAIGPLSQRSNRRLNISVRLKDLAQYKSHLPAENDTASHSITPTTHAAACVTLAKSTSKELRESDHTKPRASNGSPGLEWWRWGESNQSGGIATKNGDIPRFAPLQRHKHARRSAPKSVTPASLVVTHAHMQTMERYSHLDGTSSLFPRRADDSF